MLYTQAIHYGTSYTGSPYYTAQHVYYYTYTEPLAHSTVHTILCTYIHLLDTYIVNDVYTYTIQHMWIHTYHTIHVCYWMIIK